MPYKTEPSSGLLSPLQALSFSPCLPSGFVLSGSLNDQAAMTPLLHMGTAVAIVAQCNLHPQQTQCSVHAKFTVHAPIMFVGLSYMFKHVKFTFYSVTLTLLPIKSNHTEP